MSQYNKIVQGSVCTLHNLKPVAIYTLSYHVKKDIYFKKKKTIHWVNDVYNIQRTTLLCIYI